jgi:hypothetical protein
MGQKVLDFLLLPLVPTVDNPVDSMKIFSERHPGVTFGAIVGIGAAWNLRSLLGMRGTIVMSMVVSVLFISKITFAAESPKEAIPIVATVFAELPQGAVAGPGWKLFATAVPRESVNKYTTLFLVLTEAFYQVISTLRAQPLVMSVSSAF